MSNTSRIATVHKNGSSLAVVIPSVMCRQFGIKRGDQVVVYTDQRNNIVMRKMTLQAYKAMRA